MKYAKLPEPTVINGRMFYTAGECREFGKQCVELNLEIKEEYVQSSTKPDKDFFDVFGNIF